MYTAVGGCFDGEGKVPNVGVAGFSGDVMQQVRVEKRAAYHSKEKETEKKMKKVERKGKERERKGKGKKGPKIE